MIHLQTQPQSVGDLTGRAFRIYRQNILLIFQILLIPSAFITVGKVSLQWGIGNLQTGIFNAQSFLAALLGLIIALYFLWIFTLRQLALVRIFNNQDTDYQEAYRLIKSRQVQIFCVGLISYIAILLTATLWTIEIIFSAILIRYNILNVGSSLALVVFGFVGMALSAIGIGIFGLITMIATATEKKRSTEILWEVFNLTSSGLVRSYFFGFLVVLCISVLIVPLSFPIFVTLAGFQFLKQGLTIEIFEGFFQISLISMVIIQTWESITNMILWPIIFLSYGIFYEDLKVRQEASDVVHYLNQAQLGET